MNARLQLFRRLLHQRSVVMNKKSKDAKIISSQQPAVSAIPSPPQKPVGPGASKDGEYKVTEYFQYNMMSYFDLECEMTQYRLPQPSSNRTAS